MAVLVDEKLAKLSAEEARILAEHYQLLNHITSYGSAGHGATLVYFNHHIKNIEVILKQISDLYTRTYNSNGKLNGPKFYANRRALFLRLDNTLKTFIGHAKMGFDFDQGRIKNSLGLNTKSILHQWKAQPSPVIGVPGFAKNFNNVANASKILKGAGYVGIALDGAHSAVNIHEACTVGTKQQCTRTSFREGGRLTGSVGGGALGGFGAAYLTCNVLFGIETVGTSLLWCGIVAV